MRRTVRYAASAAAIGGVLALAACDKPAPKVTAQSGSTSMTVSPSSYSWDSTHLKKFVASLPEITTKTDGTVLVDVPRRVANAGWAISAISLSNTAKAIGGSGQIKDRHTFRVAAQTNNGQPFIVRVDEYRNGKPDGSVWNFLVKVDDGT